MSEIKKGVQILDCTLRDGGYYTNWDFDKQLVQAYLNACNKLPIDWIEIGYRSPAKESYLGQYFYLPEYLIRDTKSRTTKKIALILNEKDIDPQTVRALLGDCIGHVDMIRMAVNPIRMDQAIELAKRVKEMGFLVAFNVMYMSTWDQIEGFYEKLSQLNGLIDYFYLVDSYGGVYPAEVTKAVEKVRSKLDISIGFHGHNNLELGLINTLTAIEVGADVVDATFTGMGRGAGNLKTELLLTSLSSRHGLSVDFNALGNVVGAFERLQKEYGWGTNLPYMVSGANSLPQKEVMEWVTKRFYSVNSIIQALNNQSEGIEDNLKLSLFNSKKHYKIALIVGGGDSVKQHEEAILHWVKKQDELCIIHASSKNANTFIELSKDQFFCLVGNEGHRLENQVHGSFGFVTQCVLPPYPRKMGTYIPATLEKKSAELKEITFTNRVKDSHTVLALQTALELQAQSIYVIGYDGYSGDAVSQNEIELSTENEALFFEFVKVGTQLSSLTPTRYKGLKPDSVYSRI